MQIFLCKVAEHAGNCLNIVRDFILIVVKVKQCSELSQRYQFKSSEVK